MRKVVHFEIPADDVDRATRFYRSIFGWRLTNVPGMDYTSVVTTPVDEESQLPREPGAINGGLYRRSADLPSTPVLTIDVESVDDALKQIEAAGGSVVQPRTELPGMGAFAYFTDPEGNTLGLWENA
jgi:predicted enzyme related to lactoylglutathione lyase